MKSRLFSYFAVSCTLLSFWLFPSDCSALDRCNKYLPQIVRESRFFLGMEAPHHYFAGQIEQESRCREGVTAFDGGMGLGQFMPATAKEMQEKEVALREIGAEPMPYDSRWAIRALILYDRNLYARTDCEGWYFAFRAYNGGVGAVNREIARAGSCEKPAVEKQCRRRVLTLKNGSKLDLCQVNIEYPYLIFKRAETYRRIADDEHWSLSLDSRTCAGCHDYRHYRL